MSGNKPCKSVLWSCADFSRSGIRVFACPVESMSNEITNIGLSVAFAVNICALLSVLMLRYRTARNAPLVCPWPVAVLYRNGFRSGQLRAEKAEPASCVLLVSRCRVNQEGADPNGPGSADSYEEKP